MGLFPSKEVDSEPAGEHQYRGNGPKGQVARRNDKPADRSGDPHKAEREKQQGTELGHKQSTGYLLNLRPARQGQPAIISNERITRRLTIIIKTSNTHP